MKKLLIIALVLLCTMSAVSAQGGTIGTEETKKASLTVGLLQGGGSLVGADFEALISDRVGLQIGAGFSGYGAGLNYHLKPGINSSFLSLSYWNQGIGDSFTQRLIGPTFVYRARKIFTAQIGLGFVLERGPAYPSHLGEPPVILMYSIGAYFPL